MRLAFTGTKHGLTGYQVEVLHAAMLKEYMRHKFMPVHGGCVGADVMFHLLAVAMGVKVIEIFPSTDRQTNRVAELLRLTPDTVKVVVHQSKLPLVRNYNIIEDAFLLLACPRQPEMILRSGTWATVRLAEKNKIPYRLITP